MTTNILPHHQQSQIDLGFLRKMQVVNLLPSELCLSICTQSCFVCSASCFVYFSKCSVCSSSFSVYLSSCSVYFDCRPACSICPYLFLHILTTLPVPSALHLVSHILTVILLVPYLVMCALAAILSVPYVNNLSCTFCLLSVLFPCIIAAIKSFPSVQLLVLCILAAVLAVPSYPHLVLQIGCSYIFSVLC